MWGVFVEACGLSMGEVAHLQLHSEMIFSL